jgi:hypothetical protein
MAILLENDDFASNLEFQTSWEIVTEGNGIFKIHHCFQSIPQSETALRTFLVEKQILLFKIIESNSNTFYTAVFSRFLELVYLNYNPTLTEPYKIGLANTLDQIIEKQELFSRELMSDIFLFRNSFLPYFNERGPVIDFLYSSNQKNSQILANTLRLIAYIAVDSCDPLCNEYKNSILKGQSAQGSLYTYIATALNITIREHYWLTSHEYIEFKSKNTENPTTENLIINLFRAGNKYAVLCTIQEMEDTVFDMRNKVFLRE